MTQINLLVRVGLASTLWLSLGPCSSSCVQAFGARLVRPWELETKFTSMISSATIHNPSWTALSRKTTHQKRLVRIQTQSNDNDPGVPQEENQKEIISSSSSSSSSAESLSTTPPSFSLATSSNASLAATTAVKNIPKNINGAAAAVAVPTVLSSIGPLWTLVRPSNFPGIVLFHMLGVHLALSASNKSLSYWSTLLQQPSMWLVLAALILTSSTSMVVNDYYDAKLGRDVDTDKALAAGKIPLATARRFLRYLYGVALVVTCALPGLSTRLAVLMGLLLTYFYTQSLKPVTWLKNVVCASLIALAPVTSGSAALHLVHANPAAAGWQVASVPALWRLTASLFCGILGREIMMDCNDVENDAKAHVQTLPVVHGRRYVLQHASNMVGPQECTLTMCAH